MDHQDWTTVVLKRNTPKKESRGDGFIQVRNPNLNEQLRFAKLESNDGVDLPKKRVHSESLQALIRKRMEMKLNQEMADQVCSFPRNTFKNIESHRLIPTQKQQSMIQKIFGVPIKIDTIE